jgi:hypothetical protein
MLLSMVKRVILNSKAKQAAKSRVVPIRRTPLGVMSIVHRPDMETEKKVFLFAASLLSETQMAALLEIDENELRLTYARTIAKGRADSIFKVAKAVVDAGSGVGNTLNKEQMSAALFILKSAAGMSENAGGSANGNSPDDARGNQLDDAGRKRQLARLLKFAGAAAARRPGTSD